MASITYVSILVVLAVAAHGEYMDMSHLFEANVTIYWPGLKKFRLENQFKGDITAANGEKVW